MEAPSQSPRLEAHGAAPLVLPAEDQRCIQQLIAAADQLEQKRALGRPKMAKLEQKRALGRPKMAKLEQIIAILESGDYHNWPTTVRAVGREVDAARESLLPALREAEAWQQEAFDRIALAEASLAVANGRENSLASHIRWCQSQIAGLEAQRHAAQEEMRHQTLVLSQLE